MNLYLAQHLARELMQRHGLSGWSFRFDHARRRFGSCQPGRKLLTLSRPLTLLNDEPQVRETILHEIAHALAPDDGHGARWRAACLKVGARPVRCYDTDEVVSPRAPMQIGCPRCNWWVDRRRRSGKKLLCRHCEKPVEYRLTPVA